MTKKYSELIEELKNLIPDERIFSDKLRTFAFGTDASFYRLTPKIVVKVVSEDEVVFVIKKCSKFNIPLTFRASGTSLSGQSISDSVLLVADRSWNQIKISDDGKKITVDPGVLGGRANLELAKLNKKIGPDPASINAATVTGIAANNASGMTSGVAKNSYNTLDEMRIVFANGEVLNTADEKDREDFIQKNRELVIELITIASEIENNSSILKKIVNKYKINNTTGYSINAFVDFQDPIEIIKHLMIGSEGTLGFISQITFKTVPSLPNKATSLIIFPDVKTACSAIPLLKNMPVDAAEIMDRSSLKSVENKKGLPEYLKELGGEAAALLIETSGVDEAILNRNIDRIKSELKNINTIRPVEFTKDPNEYMKLWNVRKGLFPSVSKSRPSGTTVVIEDVNFDTSVLAEAVGDLQLLFKKHDYNDTIIWGHALSGNIHFVFAQDFNNNYEIRRYQDLMNDVVLLVIDKYNGSLKAEHGTGRNMAPFVKYEWGKEIYDFMVRTKKAFDPKGILNPGVLINDDSEIYIKNLKPTPIVDPIIDKCIDCGFCENNCPSKNLTLTPRQRIAVWRKINSSQSSEKIISKELLKSFKYQGDQTCATDGLCELSCPVDIDTGKLIKSIRFQNKNRISNLIANIIGNNFSITTASLKVILNILKILRQILGEKNISAIFTGFRKLSFGFLPEWNRFLPAGSRSKFKNTIGKEKSVVYFPSCISRTMGNFIDSKYEDEQSAVMNRLFVKAGYSVIYPRKLTKLCCGMPFLSKGFIKQGEKKTEELINELKIVSNNGEIPIVFDTSPCVRTVKEYLEKKNDFKLEIYDNIEFLADNVVDSLQIKKITERITVHLTCSSTKMELRDKLLKIANACAEDVYIPEDIDCCGFAGDRGFNFPELNKSALNTLRESVQKENCTSGFSSSKTCEIGLSLHSGIEYNSIAYLVDDCSEKTEGK
jgi:D-lactate dehydrogenase